MFMKYLLIPLLIFIAGCGSGNDGGPKTPDNSDTNKVNSVGDNKFNADTGQIASTDDPKATSKQSGTPVLFIGEFATWHSTGGDNFDGLYDSTQSLFSLCSTNKVEHVVASEISYDQYASCDTVGHKRVMLFMKDSLGRLNPNGFSLNVVGDHAQVIGDPSRIIKLSPAAINRINTMKVIRHPPADGNATHTVSGDKQLLQDHQMITDSPKLMQINRPKQQLMMRRR
jgi:hypothetical protein